MCHCLNFGNVSLPPCKKYDICPSCDKAPLPGLWQIWARLHSTHPLKRRADLGADPTQYSPAITRGFESSDMPISARFPHSVGGSGGKGSIFCNTMAQTKFKCSDILIQISNHSHFLCLTYVAVTDPCHAMNYRCESHVA
jgi:hypothetical protein